MPVPAILLAAGASRRLGQPKQLLAFDGEALLERALRLAAEAGANPRIAVLGAQFAPICAQVAFHSAIPVLNEHWEQGMATSIRAGLEELDARAPDAAGVLVMTCDQPRLTASHLRALLAAFAGQPAPVIVASSYAGVRGIPAVFPRSVFPQLLALKGDKGARAVIEASTCPILELPFEGGEIDIDLPADLAHLE
ncbi:MAG TPA: nucleotidyltransferase family protein [Terracidiphilus sp.]|nr:nucleotidyltransferase family protein [Terracidiphilus sp.]